MIVPYSAELRVAQGLQKIGKRQMILGSVTARDSRTDFQHLLMVKLDEATDQAAWLPR